MDPASRVPPRSRAPAPSRPPASRASGVSTSSPSSRVPESAVDAEYGEQQQLQLGAYVFYAAYCCFNGCDMDNIMLCCKGENELLCCVEEHCCAAMVEPYGIGMVTDEENGECCKLGMFCCTLGCKQPKVCCSGASQFLCFVQVQSLPLDSWYLSEPVCGWCGFSILPTVGCGQAWPRSQALEKIKEFTKPASEVMVR